MRSLVIASLLVILFFASVNAEANTEAVRSTSVSSANFKKPCCKTGCLECNRCGNVKKSTKIRRLCKIKKFSRCYNRKRCCKKITTCKGGFCKTTRRKCSWVGKKIKRFCKIIKRVTRITCSLYADPHVHGFNKKYFEAQTVGDWILYKGENLQAHYRGKSFGRWVGAVKFGVKLYNNWIFSTGFKYDTLIVNGEIRNFPVGKTKLGKGFVNRNGNKITFSTNDGEEVDFVSFGSFFNAYVRSNVEKISGICSQQFIKSKIFGHPRDGKIIKIKKVKCPKRKQHVASCKKKGLKGGALRNCVADLCNGLPKKIEKEIIKINKKEDKKKIIKKRKQPRGTQVFCELYADPHVKGFNKRFFEAQTVGDWVLYRGDDLSAHYRGKSFGRWVGAVKFGVRLFSHKIYSVGFAFDSLIIDGVRRPIANGQTRLGKGTITRNNNKITFSTNEGEEVDFITFGSFFNGYVRSNLKSSAGICSQQFIRSHFFGHYHEGKVITIKPQNCPNRAAFRNQCKAKGLKRGALRNCVADLCNGLDRKIERKIIRDNRREKKKRIHIRPRPRPRHPRPVINVVHRPRPPVVHRRPPVVVRRPVFTPRPFPVRRVFRRRGRGDVWLQTKTGAWIDVNDEGTFNYLLDKKNNVKIDVQFSNVGKGSVISAVSIQARGKKIVAESDGKITVDGKPIKRKSAIFKFTKDNKVNVFKLKGKRGQFEIRGLGKERFSFEYEEETNSYMIVVGSLSKHHEGLSADPEHPEKYQLKKEESIFASYKEFKKNKPVEATEDDKKEAEKCCAKLNDVKKKECVSDFIRTGECLHYYEDKQPSLNDK